jgi:hypothetical protein
VRPSIPLSAPGRLVRAARWTTVARIVLGLALAGTLYLAWHAARDNRRSDALFPANGSPIIALDLSWSVSFDRSTLIEQTMRSFADSGRRLGLILFSDTAYEALPPGTRASALRPFLRFFDGRADTNPWRATFSAGTRISGALALARELIARDHVSDPEVTLISDLSDSPGDEVDLTRQLVVYQQQQIPIHMIGINPQPADEQFFRQALEPGGGSVTALRGDAVRHTAAPSGTRFPVALVVAAGLLALLLALNEHLLGALSWGRRQPA